MKIKQKTSRYILVAGMVAIVASFFQPNLELTIKEAKAEQACPAAIPTSNLTLRSGGDNGPVLGTYHNDGWNSSSGQANPTTATLEVPAGTVVYFAGNVTGFAGPNRSVGAVHTGLGPATITYPGDKVGYYPEGYRFIRQSAARGYTDPITINNPMTLMASADYSCWGGDDDGVTSLTVYVQVQGAPPAPTQKTFSNTLAIVKDPTVSLLANGAGSVNINSGDSVSLSWSTDSVNLGNSCTASNDNSDANWNGAKVGQTSFTPPDPAPPSGGTQSVGPFNTPGTYHYNIVCYGLNNVPSAMSQAIIIVGSAASYVCVPDPISQSINIGSNGTVSLSVVPSNGFNSPVTFTASVVPGGRSSPTVSFANNPQSSPYSTPTIATITTTARTSPGNYQIQFTGTGGSGCTTTTDLTVTDFTPSSDIQCDSTQGPCSVPSGGSSNISWTYQNVSSCDIYKYTVSNPTPVLWSSSPTTSKNSGPLTEATTFSISCTGPYGSPAPDQVVVNVNNAGTVYPPVVTTNNTQCGKVIVDWSPSNKGVLPTGYRVYRGNSSDPNSGVWTVISSPPDPLPSSTLTLTDLNAASSNNYYKVIAYNGLTPSDPQDPAVLGNKQSCVPIMDLSDKDIIHVAGKFSQNFASSPCNGQSDIVTLPNNAVFSVGDKVTFKINVCNSGPADLTGVSILDTLTNLVDPTFDSLDPCVTGYNYNSKDNTITFDLNTIGAGNKGTQSCPVEFTATIVAPSVTNAALYRFQNIADITTNELPTKRVITPPYLFNVNGGIPDRTETAPN